jgi:lysophospholipid acyltransferase (LPLAT)-like uncharacterized protein
MSATPPSTSKTTQPRPKKRGGGVVVPHQPTWYQRAAARAIHLTIQSVSLTLRYKWDEPAHIFPADPPSPVIYCTWHNRLTLCLIAYWRYSRKYNPTPGLAAMVSASKDGGFLAGILECFGVEPVRGSSSRRGPQAMLELVSWAERGYDLAITPDGPRGPCYVVQDGVMSLAQVTGLPILPFSFNLDWKIRLKSWDRFQIPLPFSRCEMRFADAIRVPRDASDAEREQLRQRLEASLRGLTRE